MTDADPDAAEIRDVLREHGYDIPDRGRLSAAHRARYHELMTAGPEPGGQAAELDGGDLAGPGGDDSAGPGGQPAELAAPAAERAPSRPHKTRGGWLGRAGGRGPQNGAQGRAPAKRRRAARPRRERISLEGLGSRVWDGLGRAAGNLLPATGRCMMMQAPLAGVVAEDAIRGTFIDPVVQPLAQAEQSLEKVAALVLTPVCVAGIEMSYGLPEREMLARQSIIMPILRECLVIQIRAQGEVGERVAIEAAGLGELQQQVDRMLRLIFPQPAADEDQAADEVGDPVAAAQQAAGATV